MNLDARSRMAVCGTGARFGQKRPLVGWLSGSASKMARLFADDFLDDMLGLGYLDGRDLDFVSGTQRAFRIGYRRLRKRWSVSSLASS